MTIYHAITTSRWTRAASMLIGVVMAFCLLFLPSHAISHELDSDHSSECAICLMGGAFAAGWIAVSFRFLKEKREEHGSSIAEPAVIYLRQILIFCAGSRAPPR